MQNVYIAEDIANRIRARAAEQGKSIHGLLTEARLGVNTVSKMANGADITTRNFARIADCLECSVDYLLGRTDNPEVNREPPR